MNDDDDDREAADTFFVKGCIKQRTKLTWNFCWFEFYVAEVDQGTPLPASCTVSGTNPLAVKATSNFSLLPAEWPVKEIIQIRDDWETLVRMPAYSIEMFFELEIEQRKKDDKDKGTFHLVRVLRVRRQTSKLTLAKKSIEKALRHRTWLTGAQVKFILDRLPASSNSMASFNLGANNEELSSYLWALYSRHFVTSEYLKLTVDYGMDFRIIQRLGDEEMQELLERVSDKEFLWQLCVASASYDWNEIAADAAALVASRPGHHPRGWMQPMFPVGLREATFNPKRMKEPLVDKERGDAPFDENVIMFCGKSMQFAVHTYGNSIVRFRYGKRPSEEAKQKLAQLRTLDTLGVFSILTRDLPAFGALPITEQERREQESGMMLHPDHPRARGRAGAGQDDNDNDDDDDAMIMEAEDENPNAAEQPRVMAVVATTAPDYIEAVPCFIQRAVDALVSYMDAMHKTGRLALVETSGPWYYDYVSTKIIQPMLESGVRGSIQCVCPNDAYVEKFREFTGLADGVISWTKIQSTTLIQQALYNRTRTKKARFKLFIVDSLHMWSIVDLYNLLCVLFKGSIAKLILLGDPHHVPLCPGPGKYEKVCQDLFRPYRHSRRQQQQSSATAAAAAAAAAQVEDAVVSTYNVTRIDLSEMMASAETFSIPLTFTTELMDVVMQPRQRSGRAWQNNQLRDAVLNSKRRVEFMNFMDFVKQGMGVQSGGYQNIVFCASKHRVDDLYAIEQRRHPEQARNKFTLRIGDWLWVPDVQQNVKITELMQRRDDSDNGLWKHVNNNECKSCRKELLVAKLEQPCDSHRRCCGLHVNYLIDKNDKNTFCPDMHPWVCRTRFITPDMWCRPTVDEKIYIVLDIPEAMQQNGQQQQRGGPDQTTMMDYSQFHTIMTRAQGRVVIVGDELLLAEVLEKQPEFRSSYLRHKMMHV